MVKDKPTTAELLNRLEPLREALSKLLRKRKGISKEDKVDLRDLDEALEEVHAVAARDGLSLQELEEALEFCSEVSELLSKLSGSSPDA